MLPGLGLSLLLNVLNRGVLNSDGIAYLQLGEHYLNGRFDLAVNGYWGPLFSWLLVPLLATGLDPQLCARVLMILSAGVFIRGSWAWLKSFQLDAGVLRKGMVCCVVGGALWSAQNITPDLLLAGIALVALAETRRAFHGLDGSAGWLAGISWGIAFLTKAVALPWAMLLIFFQTVMHLRTRTAVWKAAVRLFIGFGGVALPWIIVLSVHEGRFTFSTTGTAAHALAGPVDVDRYHPTFIELHSPRAGRITSWENPAEQTYRSWSPFASQENFIHQIKTMLGNVLKLMFLITSLVPVWLMTLRTWNRISTREQRVLWTETQLPLNLLCLIYLPFYLAIVEQRYFYIAVPTLWAAMHLQRIGPTEAWRQPPWSIRWQNFSLVAIIGAMGLSFFAYQYPARVAGGDARELAAWLESQNQSGSVAGSALRPGGRAGLYTAWYLRQSWMGDVRDPDASAYLNSGARLIVLNPADPLIARLLDRTNMVSVELPASLASRFAVVEVRPASPAR